MEILFWSALAPVLYVYSAIRRFWPHGRASRRGPCSGRRHPADVDRHRRTERGPALRARLDNLLAVDYPADRLQIIVVSDGSTDGTADILQQYRGRVDSILLPQGGKASALNAGVAAARHEILVFADARQTFARDALRALVAPFADPGVGGVSGELVLDCESGGGESTIGEGVGAYWRYEKWLRRHESLVGSIVGSTGAIHALRRELWQPLPAETILDDVLAPMQAVLSGARVIFEGSARAYDRVVAAAATEFRRKTRTLAGNYQLLRLQPRLLVPFVNPVWLQFVSHKLGRLVVPYALCALLVSSAVLAGISWFYAAAFVGQLALLRPRVVWRGARAARTAGAARALGNPCLMTSLRGICHE